MTQDPFAPKGDIREVHKAFLRIGQPSERMFFPYGVDINAVLRSIACKFNQSRAIKAPRPKAVRESLDRVARAATMLVSELEKLDPYVRDTLLGDVVVHPWLMEPIPNTDRSIAFAPEIGEQRSDARQYLEPMTERLKALSRIAKRSQRAVPVDKGGNVTNSRAGVESHKTELALDCFWLVSWCFGYEVAKERMTGTTSGFNPLFLGLTSAMFKFAVGDDYSQEEENFDRAIKKAITMVRSDRGEWLIFGRPWPLEDAFARSMNAPSQTRDVTHPN